MEEESSRPKSKCKGPVAGTCLVASDGKREANAVTEEQMLRTGRGRVFGGMMCEPMCCRDGFVLQKPFPTQSANRSSLHWL